MSKLKRAFEIVITNWIHFIGFYVTTYLTLIVFKIFGLENAGTDPWSEFLIETLVGILVLFFTYGLLVISAFFGILILLDLILFNINRLKVLEILLIEWAILIIPFIYWGFEYDYPLWFILSLSFLGTQLMRKKELEKIKN